MGVYTYSEDNPSLVAPSRLFKALIEDSQTIIPKLLPQVIKSITFLEGDGAVGSIRLITFHEENISFEIEFVAGPEGGAIGKMKTIYVTKGDESPPEEEINKGKQTGLAMFKAVEGFLLQNPDAYV
ncbi:Class-10 pathogenesis-related protein 1 [Linum perenne]